VADYEQYKAAVRADVARTIAEKGCQPILFVGSGFTKRYANAPNWEQLLGQLRGICPAIKFDVPYYVQSKKTYPEIGSVYAAAFKEWAWGEGKKFFPPEYFSSNVDEDIFIKFAVTKQLESLGDFKIEDQELLAEIAAFKSINPHAIITTNYDRLLEPIFGEYTPVVGQQVIRHAYISIGEIFKIHGCVTDPGSLLLTAADYSKFANDKKYLTAKLFAFFVEHPMLFVGYSASDPNIKAILQEVDHMLPEGTSVVPNIYLLQWDRTLTPESYPAVEEVIDVGDGRTVRVKNITASSFEWVFNAFKSELPLEKVNVKLLRSISHRVVDLVRKDAARNVVEINFEMLSHALENPQDFAKVFGIAAMNDPALLNVMYPMLPSEAAEKLGFKDWNFLNQLIAKLKKLTGFDMRASDNEYHVNIPRKKGPGMRRYSQAAVDLLEKVRDGADLPDLSRFNEQAPAAAAA
jgi:hypothetical protein